MIEKGDCVKAHLHGLRREFAVPLLSGTPRLPHDVLALVTDRIAADLGHALRMPPTTPSL